MRNASRLLLASMLFALLAGISSGEETARTQRAKEAAKVFGVLDRRVSVDLPPDSTLDAYVAALCKQVDVEYIVDRRAFEVIGVSVDQIVNRRIHDLRFQDALELVLGDLGELGWDIRGDRLVITTDEQLVNQLRPYIFDVTDLTIHEAEDGVYFRDSEALIDLLYSCVDPSSWGAMGGEGLAETLLVGEHDLLIVSTPPRMVLEMRRLFQDIRAVRDGKAPSGVAIDEAWEGRLRKRIDVDFQETPFSEAIEHIERELGKPLLVDYRALEIVGVSRDDPVTIRANSIAIETLLDTILGNLEYLSFEAFDNFGWITTEEEAVNHLDARPYDVTTLCGNDSHAEEAIIEVLQTAVRPTTWQAMGGEGTIEWYKIGDRRLLIIRTTWEIHHEIEELLGDLEQMGAAPPLPHMENVDWDQVRESIRAIDPTVPDFAAEPDGWGY